MTDTGNATDATKAAEAAITLVLGMILTIGRHDVVGLI